MAQLPGDDADVHALAPQLRGMGVSQPVGVHALGDPGPVKGSSSQAIQNMNLMLDLPETPALEQQPLFP